MSAGAEEVARWTCVCGHTIHEHGQGDNDAVECNACDCPDFITEAEADEVTDVIYEWALADGETWATTAHEYRRHRKGASRHDESGPAVSSQPTAYVPERLGPDTP